MARIEKLGKPAVLVVARGFESNARLNARNEGLSDISLAVLPVAMVPLPKEIEDAGLGEQMADKVVAALTRRASAPVERKETVEEALVFKGNDYSEAVENMERHFLQHCWSDGFPIVAPTEWAVNRMLEGTELPRHHVVGLVEPGGAEATVEKIAINAVMAGCLPQYLPVVIAAVEAITDPTMFDLRGVQCTTGMVSPLLIVSGPRLIEQLNINDGFSTLGPGWRANATIGRAIRLLMINVGLGWPGITDMKAIGSPFKYVSLMAENEGAYLGAWEPIRVAEGFDHDQPTVSVMPALTWQADYIPPDLATTSTLIGLVAKQGKVKYDRFASNWGMENLVLLSPTTFDVIRKEGLSRAEVQKMLYEAVRLPGREFWAGREPSREAARAAPVPDWLIRECRADPDALVPLLPRPEDIKIVVAGAPGPAMFVYVGTWGFGPAHFVTKPVRLPPNWESLLDKHRGWDTPVVR